MKKLSGILLSAVLLFVVAAQTFGASAAVAAHVTGGQWNSEDGSQHYLKFTLDAQVVDATVSQPQADAQYKEMFGQNVFLDGKSVAEINRDGDYNIMFLINTDNIDLVIGKTRLDITKAFTFEIRSALTFGENTIEPVKMQFEPTTKKFTVVKEEVPPEEKQPVQVSGDAVTESADGNYHVLSFLLDTKVTDADIGNAQTQEGLADEVKNHIYLNGKSLGTWYTETGDLYCAMVNILTSSSETPGSLHIWVGKTNSMGIAAGKPIEMEIKEGVDLGGYVLQPVHLQYDPAVGQWKDYEEEIPGGDGDDDDDQGETGDKEVKVNIIGGSGFIAEAAHYQTHLYLDTKVTDEALANQQEPGKAYADQIRSALFVNGKSVGEWCEQAGHNYAVMVNIQPPFDDQQGSLNLWFDKINILGIDPESEVTVEIREPITLGKAVIQPASFVFDPEKEEWVAFTGEREVPVHVTAGQDFVEEDAFLYVRFVLDQSMTGTLMSNIQADEEMGTLVRSSLYFNGKSLQAWCDQAEHNYAAMVNIQPPTGKDKGYLEIWFDKTNILGVSREAAVEFEIRQPIAIGEKVLQPAHMVYDPVSHTWSTKSVQTGVPLPLAAVGVTAVAFAVTGLCICKRKKAVRG